MKKLYLVCVLSFCALTDASFAAQAETASNRIPTVTRLVQLFTGLEATLLDAQFKGDAAALGNLLTDNFEMRIDATPGEPIPRAEWLKRVIEQRRAGQSEQMAVHDYGDIAIVSFLLKSEVTTKHPNAVFMVDVWRRAGTDWKLATRYAANATSSSQHISGVPIKGQGFEKRY
jgi:hypothetical protein